MWDVVATCDEASPGEQSVTAEQKRKEIPKSVCGYSGRLCCLCWLTSELTLGFLTIQRCNGLIPRGPAAATQKCKNVCVCLPFNLCRGAQAIATTAATPPASTSDGKVSTRLAHVLTPCPCFAAIPYRAAGGDSTMEAPSRLTDSRPISSMSVRAAIGRVTGAHWHQAPSWGERRCASASCALGDVGVQ